jgi:hypothetical protein
MDVEMLDVSSGTSSPKSSVSNTEFGDDRPRNQTLKQGPTKSSLSNQSEIPSIAERARKPPAAGMAVFGISQHRKRSREPSEDDMNVAPKKVSTSLSLFVAIEEVNIFHLGESCSVVNISYLHKDSNISHL